MKTPQALTIAAAGLASLAIISAPGNAEALPLTSPTPTSQNGHPLITQEQTVTWEVGGVTFWTAPGDATSLLHDLVVWYDQNIEPVADGNGDDWSWAAPALVPPSNTYYSNHGSGTAVDLNVEKHAGQYASGTFTPDQVAKIHDKLASYGGRVIWGGDWTDIPDEPHFELAPLL